MSSQAELLVRATLPAVVERGTEISSVFYDRMFAAHPSLLNVFNRGNQANGDQRQALAMAVVACAAHLVDGDDASGFEPMTRRIAHKHASLGIRPDQYAIVGRYLLGAVDSVLGDAVTAEVHAAWDEVYWAFATALVAAEGELYKWSGVDMARPWRPWQVAGRTPAGEDVVALELVPADGGPIPEFRPGQYVTVNVELSPGNHQPRQYTLCRGPGRPSLQITVSRERGDAGAPDGMVSCHLHDALRVGDVLSVSYPFGDVTLDESDDPLLLISAGVGVTPMAAIIDHLGRSRPARPVVAAHADHASGTHPLRDQVREAARLLNHYEELTWYGELTATDRRAGVRQGRMDVYSLPLADDATTYVCGPLAFLSATVDGLLGRGVAAERIHYEIFGPDLFASRFSRPA
ncbi:MAG: globin domain-containing protein [Actinomycetota bacterium]|nr:globin domain-containing protein [Actinomycetota bacterium]